MTLHDPSRTGGTQPGVGGVPTGATQPGVTGSTQPGVAGAGQTGVEDNRSVGEIVGDIARDMSNLIRQEMDLAKTEMKQEAAKAGKGAGLLGGAGATGYLALFFLSLALMFLLDTWMHTALAALIVTVIWAIVAAVLASTGRKELKQVDPSLQTTQRTLKEDVQWAKDQKNR
jgi:uncharacterized membrane protein YqjE